MGPESKAPSPQLSGSYLYDVLADGARSFPFRSGVSSLLGISDGGNGFMKLPPTFHPLGFICPQLAGRGHAIPDLQSTHRMSLSPAVQSKELCNSCIEECEVAQPEPLDEYKEETLAERCSGNDGAERESLVATPEKAAGILSRRIEIPGVTDSKLTFHQRSTLTEDQSEPAELILHERNSSHDIGRQLEEERHSEQRKARESVVIRGPKSQCTDSVDNNDCTKQASHMNKPEKVMSAVISGGSDIRCDDMTIEKALSDPSAIKPYRIGIPGITEKKDIVHPLSVASEDLSSPSGLSDNPDQGMNAQKMRGDLSVRRASEAKPTMRSIPGKNLIASMPEVSQTATDFQENALANKADFKNSCVVQPDRDMAGILDTLENHLRQRIDQLRDASKKQPLMGSADMEETEKKREREQIQQVQPPLQQRIVVVRHSSRRNSAPAAFWERSYLGRFRLRPLR